MLDKPKKGQEVYLLLAKDYYDRNKMIHEPRKAWIIAVGTKYITVSFKASICSWVYKFDKEYPHRQKTDYSPDEMLFFSRQAALDAQKKRIMYDQVKSVISNRPIKDYTLGQLERIASILDERITNDGLPDSHVGM